MSSRAKGVMQMRIDGMRVRKVSRMTMVHCAEPPPSPVIRNSFGFASEAPSWIRGEATGAAVDRWGSTTGAAPTPPLLCHATALVDVAAKVIVRQDVYKRQH